MTLVIASIKPNKKPFILGVAGGSGSGKTHFARALRRKLGRERCEIVFQDNFYIDQSYRFDHDGGAVNFDHPDSIDFALLAERLKSLKMGESVELPIYDFATHTRSRETLPAHPCELVIVDGILIFHAAPVRELLDEMIFFDAPEELRFQRRLQRDVRERGRTPEGVRKQFETQVKPMHDRYVEPSKAYAHTLVDDSHVYDALLNAIARKIGG